MQRVSLSLARLAPLALLVLGGCAPTPLGYGEEGSEGEPDTAISTADLSVSGAAGSYCSTTAVRGLSQQLIDELNCMRPGLMVRIDGIDNVELGGAVFPYMQADAAAALRRAARRRGGTMHVNSALRTLAQQYLLYRWYRQGRCGIGLAAQPGRSNHESGLALDVQEYSAWRSVMQSEGYSWLGSSDPVHFDYASGTDIRSLSVLAFQRLWNRAHPEDRIAEDGAYGPATESRLARAPSEGFATGASCEDDPGEPEPDASLALGVSWSREADGHYELRASAPASITRVEYFVGGYRIGTVSRSAGADFPARYTFNYAIAERLFEARGFDASGTQRALGVGLIDSVPGTAVFIRQTGEATYEIGLERASSDVRSIEVRADGFEVVDAVSGVLRSTRLASRARFTMLGSRSFEIRTFGSDGRQRGTLRRTLTLR